MSLQFEKELQSYCIMAIFLKTKGNLVENDEMQTCKNCTHLCISILTYSIQIIAPKTSLTHLKFGHVHTWRAAWIVKHPLRNICQILVRVSPRLMHTIASVSQHTHHILLLIHGSPIFQICLDCSSSYLNKSIYIIDQVKWFIGACERERGKNFSTVSAMFTHNLRAEYPSKNKGSTGIILLQLLTQESWLWGNSGCQTQICGLLSAQICFLNFDLHG